MAKILIASAAVSNYEGMDALVGHDGRVYLGRQENYFPCQRRGDFVVFRRTENVEKWRVKVYSLWIIILAVFACQA